MAMGLLSSIVEVPQEWKIESAGVRARFGFLAHGYVVSLLNEKGVNISKHISRPITEDLLDEFNLTLVMEVGQKEGIKTAFPTMSHKVFLLSEMIGQRFDIVDPIGGNLVDFQQTAKEIENILNAGYEKICELAKPPSQSPSTRSG